MAENRKLNIKQHLQNQSTKNGSQNYVKKSESNQPSMMEGPMFMMAKAYADKMPRKYKYMIGGVVYFIVAGIISTVYLLIKLILLFF